MTKYVQEYVSIFGQNKSRRKKYGKTFDEKMSCRYRKEMIKLEGIIPAIRWVI